MVLAKNYVSGNLARSFGITFFLISTVLISCKETNEIQPAEFYPLTTNVKRVYKVTENRYAINAPVTRSTYYIQEQIIDLKTTANTTDFLISRNLGNQPSGEFQTVSVIKGQRTFNILTLKEENIDYVKLVFPVSDGLVFNPNKYNTLPEAKSKCQLSSEKFNLGKLSADLLLTVVEKNDTSLIDRKLKYARYANGLGLVEFREKDLEYCQATPECIGKGIIASGKDIKYELVSITEK